MAHLPPPSVPEIPGAPQTKTLYLPAPGQHGIFVEYPGGQRRSTGKKFRDAHEALTWCEKNRIAFVFYYPDDPAQN